MNHGGNVSTTIVPETDRLRGLENALSRGWRLFPCVWIKEDGQCSCGDKKDCRHGKNPLVQWQRPDEGRSGATNDPRQVVDWELHWQSKCNWAVALDDVFVVDIDVKHGGMESHAELDENMPGLLWPTLVQETPSGGLQYFYRQPADERVPTIPQGRFPIRGFEIKANPGYVLIPPSGGRRWLSDPLRDIAEATSDLLDVIRSAKVSTTNGPNLRGSDLGEGERFNWQAALTYGAITSGQEVCLFRAAAALRTYGVPDDLAIWILREIIKNFINVDPDDPWDLGQAETKWESVKKQYSAGRSKVQLDKGQQSFIDSLQLGRRR